MIRIYRYSMILAAAALALTACSTEEPRSQWQPERGRIYLQFPTGDEATVQGEEAGTGSESRVETADVFIYDGEQCLHYERLSIPQNGAPVPLSQVLATDFVVGQPYEVHVVANYRDGEDGNASFPGVKEVVFLLVFFAVFLFLIQNSFDLMASIYEVCGLAIDRVEALFGAGGALDLPEASVVTTDDDIPSLIAMLVVSLISWVVVLAAYVVALVVCWARALQLYIMAAFAPIPLAFLGMDATRQIGLGYLKSFGAVCIAGVIILVLLISFPLVLGGLTGANPGTGTPADAVANGLTYALQYLAMCVLLILALVKSGSWARDIVSGF